MNWLEVAEKQAEELDLEEYQRKRELTEEFLSGAKKGDLYTYKYSTMDYLATELRKDFDDYETRFNADPTVAMIYLGQARRRWKKGPKSLKFLATDSHGQTAVVWLDEEWVEHICEYKRKTDD